jgi:hypothetical protein
MKRCFMIVAILTLCSSAMPTRAQDWSKVEIKVTRVAGNVYMLEGSGGNIGVSVGPDGILIVSRSYTSLTGTQTATASSSLPALTWCTWATTSSMACFRLSILKQAETWKG